METSRYNWMGTGHAAIFDKATFETFWTTFPISLIDDFIKCSLVIPVAGAAESGCPWVVHDLNGATEAILPDVSAGMFQIEITNAVEAQEGVLYQDDNRSWDITHNPIFETKLSVNTLPTDQVEMQWGFGDDYVVAGFDALSFFIGFDVDGSGALNVRKNDGVTDQTVSTGLTLGTGFYIFRIDCTDLTDIKFYVDGIQVCAGTAFPFTATGADAILQPYLVAYKAGGNGIGILISDYIKIWVNRA